MVTQDSRLDILAFPDVNAQPISPSDLVTNTFFASLPKGDGAVPGIVFDSVEYGAFKVVWQVSLPRTLSFFRSHLMSTLIRERYSSCTSCGYVPVLLSSWAITEQLASL